MLRHFKVQSITVAKLGLSWSKKTTSITRQETTTRSIPRCISSRQRPQNYPHIKSKGCRHALVQICRSTSRQRHESKSKSLANTSTRTPCGTYRDTYTRALITTYGLEWPSSRALRLPRQASTQKRLSTISLRRAN